MKKTTALLCGFTALSTISLAQPYGQEVYPNGVTLNSGTYCTINSNGFLMAGTNSGGYHVDKTDPGPAFTGSTDFRNDYTTYSNGSGCLPTAVGNINSIVGVSAIEMQVNNGRYYAVAGAYPDACFLTFLDQYGNNSSSTTETRPFAFPYSTTSIEKPYIVQSSSGDFYITGKFDTALYVIKTNYEGDYQWGQFYSSGHAYVGNALDGGIFNPSAIIVSPFNGDIIVTGRIQPPSSLGLNRAIDGFFLSLDPSNGNVNTFNWIGDTQGKCNFANAITPSFSGYGGHGYILAGMSDPFMTTPQNYGIPWVHKVDLAGNTIWDSEYTSQQDPDGGGPLGGVVERKNTMGIFEIYASGTTLGGAAFGLLTFKINKDGKPYSMVYPGRDEYYYSATSLSPIFPVVGLTYQQNTGVDDGLHIYASNNGNPYLVESYFNGVTGCSNESFANILSYESGHTSMPHWINLFGSFTNCDGLSTNYSNTSISQSYVCTAGSVGGGSNARSVATGINANTGRSGVNISPNPSSGQLNISSDRPLDLQLVNELGQTVKTLSIKDASEPVQLDNLAPGIYFITDGATVKQKIIVEK